MGAGIGRGTGRSVYVAVIVAVALALTGSSALAGTTNPVPQVTGLTPSQAMVGDLDFGITVIGSGFVQGSTVLWNGQTRDTGYISATMLTATIRASDVASAGTAFVSVSSP